MFELKQIRAREAAPQTIEGFEAAAVFSISVSRTGDCLVSGFCSGEGLARFLARFTVFGLGCKDYQQRFDIYLWCAFASLRFVFGIYPMRAFSVTPHPPCNKYAEIPTKIIAFINPLRVKRNAAQYKPARATSKPQRALRTSNLRNAQKAHSTYL